MNELEQKTFDEMVATNKLLLQMNKNQKKANKSMMWVSISGFICLTAIIISMIIGFVVFESQFEIVDTVTDSYNTETITQEVSGENSNINNVEGNQYNDNATHNE